MASSEVIAMVHVRLAGGSVVSVTFRKENMPLKTEEDSLERIMFDEVVLIESGLRVHCILA